MDKKELQQNIESKNKEIANLKAKILAENEEIKKKEFEQQQKKLEEELVVLQKQLDELKEVEKNTTTDQTSKETQKLKDTVEVDSDWTYELMKWTKMDDKLKEIGKSDAEIKKFAEKIDKVVRKFLDQELEWFPNSIKNSMSVGIQFAMMETLIKQWANGSAEFFTAFSKTDIDKGAGNAFEWLYKAFGMLWSVNEFFVLANKVQNMTWYLADKKNIITQSKNIPELMNPVQFKALLSKPIWSNQVQIDKLDITTILTLNSSTEVNIHAWEDELKKIINDDAITGVITEKTIAAIESSLNTADNLLDKRENFQDKTTDLIGKIAWFLDINIPGFGNIGELADMKFPTDIFWKREDSPLINFVLWVLGFQGWLKWLHKKYIQEKLEKLDIDNNFITAVYAAFQKNIDTTITNDSATSTWTICKLTVSDTTTESAIKAKIPADYGNLKKSLVNNLSTATLNPAMVGKFAPAAVITKDGKSAIDMTQITGKDDLFIDTYLKYIIPLLADPKDDFIQSKNIDTNSFALAVMGGLVGDKYFIEWVNIWLVATTDFKTPTAEATPDPWKLDVVNDKIDFSTWKFTPEQIKNINALIDEMKTNNILDPYTQIGILSVISKESGFVPKSEIGYWSTPTADIRTTFGDRVSKYSDTELDELKKDDKKFFDAVYGKETDLWVSMGNTESGDGYTYRGRGYNQLTFKNNYKKYGDKIGEDLVGHPDRLNDSLVASKIALAFFTEWEAAKSWKKLSELTYTTKNEAATHFADINAGGHSGSHSANAIAAATKFDVKTENVA